MYNGGEKLAEGRVEYKVMSLVFLTAVMPLVNAFHGDTETCCLEFLTAAFGHRLYISVSI